MDNKGDMNVHAYVDVDAALGRVRGNTKIYAKMLKLFTASEEFSAFDAALEAGDLTRAGEVAHGIKGMTGNLGLMALSDISAVLMTELRDGIRDGGKISEYHETLEGTRAAVDKLIEEYGTD